MPPQPAGEPTLPAWLPTLSVQQELDAFPPRPSRGPAPIASLPPLSARQGLGAFFHLPLPAAGPEPGALPPWPAGGPAPPAWLPNLSVQQVLEAFPLQKYSHCPSFQVALLLPCGYSGTPGPRPIPSQPAQSSCGTRPAPRVAVCGPAFSVLLTQPPQSRHADPPRPWPCDAAVLQQGLHLPALVVPRPFSVAGYCVKPPDIPASPSLLWPLHDAAPWPRDGDA